MDDLLLPELVDPDEDVRRARAALLDGDLRQSARHLARALRHDPCAEASLNLLQQLLAAHESPVCAPDGPLSVSQAMLCVWELAAQDQLDEATALLTQLIHASDCPFYGAWLVLWVCGALERVRLVSAARYTALLHVIVSLIPELSPTATQPLTLLHSLAALYAQAREIYPEDAELASLSAALHRKAGELDEALRIAQLAHALAPSWLTAINCALVHRASGALDAARRAYLSALQLDPQDLSAWLELGDMMCQGGRLQDGLDAYAEALAREPDNLWARAHTAYYRGLQDGQPCWRLRLDALVSAHPEAAYITVLRDALTRRHIPFVGFLPAPRGPLIDALTQRALDPARWPLDTLQALQDVPSARLAASREARAHGALWPAHDPSGGPLWRADGRALSPPPHAVLDALTRIACAPYTLDAWRALASAAASALSPHDAASLLAAMVHVPEPPPSQRPDWCWIQRFQLAAALTLACLDHGWHGSQRRAHLMALARGPADWTRDAALLALVEIAHECAESRAEVLELFSDLTRQITAHLEDPHLSDPYPLVCQMLRLPGLDDETIGWLARWRLRLEEARP